jgi:hypothetical protein
MEEWTMPGCAERENECGDFSITRWRAMRVQNIRIAGVVVLLVCAMVLAASGQQGAVVVQDIAASPTKGSSMEAYGAVPKAVDLGKESEEPALPKTLFKTKDDVRKLLGDEPRFVYNPQRLPDPMIIPWVRREVIVREILELAREKLKEGKLKEAKQSLEQALKEYPESRYINEVRGELERIQKMLAGGYGPEGVRTPQVVLPQWVASHTAGVIVDQGNPAQSVVLVGDAILRVGDKVPNYEEVVVDDIKQKEVIFRYQGRKFPVGVEAQ